MKTKFGAIIVDGRNKVGGHVLSKNRAGSYMRTKVTPVNRQSNAQTTVRSRLASLASAFRGLGAGPIAAWNNAVAQFKTTDIFGDIHSPTGITLYQRLNNNILKIGGTVITSPPLPIGVSIATTVACTAAHATPAFTVSVAPVVPTGEKCYVSATPAISPGRSFVKSDFRFIAIVDAAGGGATPIDLLTAYVAKFGSMGAAGQKIFVKVQHISSVTGQGGIPQEASCVIAT